MIPHRCSHSSIILVQEYSWVQSLFYISNWQMKKIAVFRFVFILQHELYSTSPFIPLIKQ